MANGGKRKELFERKAKLLLYIGHHNKVANKVSRLAEDLRYTPSQLYEDLDTLKAEGFVVVDGNYLVLDEKGKDFTAPMLALRSAGTYLWLVAVFTLGYSVLGLLTNQMPAIQLHFGQISFLTQIVTVALIGAIAFVLREFPILLVKHSSTWDEK